jgi:hypothetical protein
MAPPSFDPHGYLEEGIHRCTLEQLDSLLGWNACRQQLLSQLRQFLMETLEPAMGVQTPLVLDGSFVTQHEHPSDIVVVLLLDELSEDGFWRAADLYQQQKAFRERYQIRLFVQTQIGSIDALKRIQGIDPRELLEKSLDAKHVKGVVRLN